MTLEEFTGAISGLSIAYDKRYTSDEIKFMYRHFKNYTIDTFIKTIDNIVTTFEKMPPLKKIIDECERTELSNYWQNEYKKLPKAVPDKEWYGLLDSFK